MHSCLSKYDDENVQKSRIMDRLQHLQDSFNRFDTDMLMTNYHNDFYHNGRDIITQKMVWRERNAYYSSMDIEILNIDIMDDIAIVSFSLYYKDNNSVYGPYFEPDFEGDFSYFYYDKGEWLIYGNQSK